MQDLASSITILAIALVGVSVLLTQIAWRGVEANLGTRATEHRGRVVILLLVINGPVFALVATTLIVPTQVSNVFYVGYGAAALFSLIVLLIKRDWRRRPTVPFPAALFLYFEATVFLATATGFSLMALIGTVLAAFGLILGPVQVENVYSAGWVLSDGVLLFGLGTLMLGAAGYSASRAANEEAYRGG